MIIYKDVKMFKLLLGESKQTFCSYLAQEINYVFSNDLYNMDILSNVHYFTQLIGKLIRIYVNSNQFTNSLIPCVASAGICECH